MLDQETTNIAIALGIIYALAKIIAEFAKWGIEVWRERRDAKKEGTDRWTRNKDDEMRRKVNEIHDMVKALDSDGRPKVWTPRELIDAQRQIALALQQISHVLEQIREGNKRQSQIFDQLERHFEKQNH